jgi:TrmH family RNA methyltransferase
LAWLRQRHIQLLVATPSASQGYTEIDLRLPSGLIMGAEYTGVSPIWHSERPIRIPMPGQVDSLNVAQAAAILLFEAMRQRRKY